MTCNKTVAILCLVAALGCPAVAQTEEAAVPTPAGRWTPHLSGGLDLASAYIYKGMTLSDDLVAQPWLELSGLPLTLGVWGNYDLGSYDGNIRRHALSEVDLSVSRGLTLGAFEAVVGYLYCTYPTVDYENDHFATLDLSYAVIEPLRFGVYGDYTVAGSLDKNWYVRPYVNYTLTLTPDLGFDVFGKVGYLNNDDSEASDGWAHYDLGVKANYKILTAGITYIGRLNSNVLPDGIYAYDTKWVYTLGVSFEY
jgi:hypothetical protein